MFIQTHKKRVHDFTDDGKFCLGLVKRAIKRECRERIKERTHTECERLGGGGGGTE